jgi:hypothetical protein
MTLEPPAADISAGMTVYASSGDRLAGRIRASRGDFAVDELFDLGQVESERKEGYVPVYSQPGSWAKPSRATSTSRGSRTATP